MPKTPVYQTCENGTTLPSSDSGEMAGPFPYPNVEFDEWLTFSKTVPAISLYCNSPDDYVPLR